MAQYIPKLFKNCKQFLKESRQKVFLFGWCELQQVRHCAKNIATPLRLRTSRFTREPWKLRF